MAMNILTIVAEISLVFIFFFLVDWCFGRLYRQIFKISILQTAPINIAVIRRNIRGFLFFLGLLISLAILGLNGFLIYRGESVRDYSLKLLLKIPQELWIALFWGIIKSIGIIITAIIVLRFLNLLLDWVSALPCWR